MIFLFIFWIILERKSKKELNKLKEGYHEDIDKSRPSDGDIKGRSISSSGCGEEIDRSTIREPRLEDSIQSEAGRILPPTTIELPIEDKREPGTFSSKEVIDFDEKNLIL